MNHSTYTPIDPDVFELIENEISDKAFNVVYFSLSNYPQLEEIKGIARSIVSMPNEGQFILFNDNKKIRLDRVIVYNGKPGPAFDEYDAYALAPLTCKAGYDDEDKNKC